MNASNNSIGRFKYIYTGWWLIWAGIHFYVLYDLDIEVRTAIIDSLVSNGLLAGIGLLIINNMRYYLPRQERYGYLVALSLGLSITWVLLDRLFLWLLFRQVPGYADFLSHSTAVRFGIGFLMTACVSLLSLLWFSAHEQKQTDERQSDLERLAREAELYKLRQQLQPHFLFNSLNSINALIGSRPAEARHMLHQLSAFLRGTLKKEEHQWVSLQEELEYISLYLEIEKVRFGHRLVTEVIFDEITGSMQLPALLLQPIVENAIKFGLYDTTDTATIRLQARKVEKNLIIEVSNPFHPDTAKGLKGTGFGLNAVQRRLYLLFDRKDLLNTSTRENIFITTLTIPEHA